MHIKEEIQQTFKDMIIQSNHKITIIKICQQLNISRKTFYKYYDDVYDLIYQIIHHDIYEPLILLSTMNHIKTDDSITVLNSMYSSIYNQKDFYKKIKELYKEEDYLKKCIYEENYQLNTILFKHLNETEIEKEYHIYIAAMSGANLIDKWIDDDFSLSSRQIAEIFYKHIARAWVELIEHYK